jgi:hypothetical protein
MPTIQAILELHMPFVRGACRKRVNGAVMITALFTSGCSGSPSISVLGAYFPDWLFCIAAGVLLTLILYLTLKRLRADHLMWPSALVYPTLVTFLSFAVWLMLFQH